VRFILSIILVATLAGCGTTKQEPAPAPKGVDLENVGKNLDQIDSRVAASVIVARESNKEGKPEKVESELSVASAYLPKPTQEDLEYARKRALTGDASAYEAQRKKAEAKQKELESAWSKLEQQVAENKKLLESKDAKIKKLQEDLDQSNRNVWTMAGAGLMVGGALCWALLGWKIGLPLIICAPIAGSVPVIYESEYFLIIVLSAIGVACIFCLWRLWDYIRDKNNEPSDPS
jgi:hypothetical protein